MSGLWLHDTPEGRAELRRNYTYDPVAGALTLNRDYNPDVNTVYDYVTSEDYKLIQVYIDNKREASLNLRKIIWALHYDTKPPQLIFRRFPDTTDLKIDSFTSNRAVAQRTRKPATYTKPHKKTGTVAAPNPHANENYILNLAITKPDEVAEALFGLWLVDETRLSNLLATTKARVEEYKRLNARRSEGVSTGAARLDALKKETSDD